MAEQVVVICSTGEEAAALGLCSAIEARGIRCWSPTQTKSVSSATLATRIAAARAVVVITWDASEQAREIAMARETSVPVIVAVPAFNDGGTWASTVREVAQSLGIAEKPEPSAEARPASNRGVENARRPRAAIPDDEEQHIEFIAENISEAQVFVRFGLFDKAVSRLRAVLERVSHNLEAHDELLKLYLEEEELDAAAATAADYLAALRFRGEEESFDILRTHLVRTGFTVDEGPPISVAAAGHEAKPTRFSEAGKTSDAASSRRAASGAGVAGAVATEHATVARPAPVEITPLEIPILRNFSAGNAIMDGSGVDADLSGIDFLVDLGLLDEARARIARLVGDYPDHPGVLERKEKIDAVGGPKSLLGLSLALEEGWDSVPTHDEQVRTILESAETLPPAAPRAPTPMAPRPPAKPVDVPRAANPSPAPRAVARPAHASPKAVGLKSIEGDSLVCSILAPDTADSGDMFVVRACLHLPAQTEVGGLSIIGERAEAGILSMPVAKGDEVEFGLDLPGLEIDGAEARLRWAGKPESVQFGVVVPFTHGGGDVSGWLSISVNGMPTAEVRVRIAVR